MKILIVGGGIGGLALAAHLRENGENPVIVEKEKIYTDDGYVFGIWSNGLKTLARFPIQEALHKTSVFPYSFHLKDKNGTVVKHLEIDKSFQKFGSGTFLLRQDFHTILRKITMKIPIKTGISITDITQANESVSVSFTDGSTDKFDLVVGADGTFSTVREIIFGTQFLRYYGITFWVCLPPPGSIAPCINPEVLWHNNTFVGMYPYGKDSACLFFGIKRKQQTFDAPKTYVAQLQKYFAAYGSFLPSVLKKIRPSWKIYHSDMYEVTLRKFYDKRVVLIGDAAHSMIPTTGMGVSMALEDADVLARELKNAASIPQALALYNSQRTKRIRTIRRYTNFIGWMIKEENPIFLPIRNAFCRLFPNAIVMGILNFWLSRKI